MVSAVGFVVAQYPTARTVCDHFARLYETYTQQTRQDLSTGASNPQCICLQSLNVLRRKGELGSTFVPPEHAAACGTYEGGQVAGWLPTL